MRVRLLALVALTGLVSLPAPARAEDKTKMPTLVVRVPPLEEVIADARYVAGQAGREEEAKQAEEFLKALAGEKGLEGLDTRRPIGLYGQLNADVANSELVVLVPVADEKAVLDLLGRFNQKAEKDKDGVYSLQPEGSPVPVYFKFQNQYLYATVANKDILTKRQVLAPGAVFGDGKVEGYSATLNFNTIPEEVKKFAVGQVELHLANLKDKMAGETDAQHNLRVKALDELAALAKALLEDGGLVTAKFAIDRKAHDLTASLKMEPKPGSKLAKGVLDLGKTESAVAGIVGDKSAMNMNFTLTLPEDLRKLVSQAAEDGFKQALQQQGDATAREMMDQLFQALLPTVRGGKLDMAADFRGPSAKGLYTVVVAQHLKEGQKLEKALKDIHDKLPEEAKRAFALNADKAGEVAIHRVTPDKVDEDTKRVLGDGAIYFALREDAAFFGAGEDGLAALKEALAVKPKEARVLQAEMHLARVAPLMKDQPGAPEAAKEAFTEKGSDRLYVTLEGGPALQLRAGLKGAAIHFFSLLEKAQRGGDQ
jgi:hypothetical protein